MNKLKLDPGLIQEGRRLARSIVAQLEDYLFSHTTVSVERASLRLLGIDGIDSEGVPLVNRLVEQWAGLGVLGRGALHWLGRALLAEGSDPQTIAEKAAAGAIDWLALPEPPRPRLKEVLRPYVERAICHLKARREERQQLLAQLGEGPQPWLYVIVATGNIYEDVVQAQAAVRQGADIIAVIRTTGQSLLDYVPYGPTTEGFGGTYATQANFRIMRQALDEVGREVGRYIRLTNYCSGLCMPEIAVMGAWERLDVMLNDALYGIIFRDINMKRTLVDQYFSRLINGFAGIIINTGEDNYLTTADAVEAAHTVLASQLINEQFALLSGLPPAQMGLGHAFEISPELEDGFLLELAQAQLVREIFPEAPIKYMPPTKHMTGNIFLGYAQNTLFNAASIMTGQSIHLLGMLTEAIHTPFLQDRYLALRNARMVFNTMAHLQEEILFRPDGRIVRRAQEVLQKAVQLLAEVEEIGLWEALARGYFADIKRQPEGGKGLNGVVARDPFYLNPFFTLLKGGEHHAG